MVGGNPKNPETPNNRCGFELRREDVNRHYQSLNEYHKESRTVCCWRKTWKDERCIWHANVEDKPIEGLVEARADGQERLDGAVLRNIEAGAELSFVNCGLTRAIFDNVALDDANFSESVLAHAEFQDTELSDAEFHYANLQGTKFSNSTCMGAEFHHARLVGVEFHNTHLHSSTFIRANLTGARFRESDLPVADFRDAHLPRSKFAKSSLPLSKFSSVDFENASFYDSDLHAAEFSDSLLFQTVFSNTDLSSANFSGAGLQLAQFLDSKLSAARFINARLSDSKFSSVDAANANFNGSDVTNGKFLESDLSSSTFQSANGGEPTNLEDAVFEKTDLRYSDFRDARLYQTIFADVRLNSGTQFDYKNFYENAGREVSINDETHRLEAAAWVYRRLEILHEENALSEQAREFHVRKQEAERHQHKLRAMELIGDDQPWKLLSHASRWSVLTLMAVVTRHGESLKRLLVSSGSIILLCGLLYPFGGFASNETNTVYRFPIESLLQADNLDEILSVLLDSVPVFLQSIYFSVITFTTIGYGDLYPTGALSKVLIGFESLAGAILIALFIFVIGRRVAR